MSHSSNGLRHPSSKGRIQVRFLCVAHNIIRIKMTKPLKEPQAQIKYCKLCNTQLKYATQRKHLICRDCNDKAHELRVTSILDIETDLELLVNPSGRTRVHDYDTVSGFRED